jgi:squalene-hopene/tetraprenyl-beta-curcumene cyclase
MIVLAIVDRRRTQKIPALPKGFIVKHLLLATLALLALVAASLAADAEKKGPSGNEAIAPIYQTMTERAIKFLALQQGADGSISPRIGIGPTAIATLGLVRSGRGVADPQVAKGLAFLEEYVQETGGIHMPGGRIPVYETCIAMMCFKEANRDGRYNKILKNADAFIRKGQIDETKGKQKADVSYGGIGYGGKSRPDLSNTAFLIEALKSSGAKPDDPALQKALTFVSRCQNLESEHNTTKFAAKINDGGFFYTPVLDKAAVERETINGGLRSYGSMTYSGLKSMIYAGLTKDDPRVKAALAWISKNYDVTCNPGMGQAGVYYYYHTFAKSLDTLGVDEITDAKGVKHNWRNDLIQELAKRQKADGSWVNTDPQWMEGDPNLSTAFALLALSYCQPKGK